MSHVFTKEENQAWQQTLPSKRCSANVLLIRDEQALMVKADYKNYWTFPGGVVNDDESPLQAALRETHEEIGIMVSEKNIYHTLITYYQARDGFLEHLKFVFYADFGVDDRSIVFADHEIEAFSWVNFTDIAARANNLGIYRKIGDLLERGVRSSYIEI